MMDGTIVFIVAAILTAAVFIFGTFKLSEE